MLNINKVHALNEEGGKVNMVEYLNYFHQQFTAMSEVGLFVRRVLTSGRFIYNSKDQSYDCNSFNINFASFQEFIDNVTIKEMGVVITLGEHGVDNVFPGDINATVELIEDETAASNQLVRIRCVNGMECFNLITGEYSDRFTMPPPPFSLLPAQCPTSYGPVLNTNPNEIFDITNWSYTNFGDLFRVSSWDANIGPEFTSTTRSEPLVQPNGTVVHFNTDGTISKITDTAGNWLIPPVLQSGYKRVNISSGKYRIIVNDTDIVNVIYSRSTSEQYSQIDPRYSVNRYGISNVNYRTENVAFYPGYDASNVDG